MALTTLDEFNEYDGSGRRFLVILGKFDPMTTAHAKLLRTAEATLSPDLLFIGTKADRFQGKRTAFGNHATRYTIVRQVVNDVVSHTHTTTVTDDITNEPFELEGFSWYDLASSIGPFSGGLFVTWTKTAWTSYQSFIDWIMMTDDFLYDPEVDTIYLLVSSDEVEDVLSYGDQRALRNTAKVLWFPRHPQDADLEFEGAQRVLLDLEDVHEIETSNVRISLAAGMPPSLIDGVPRCLFDDQQSAAALARYITG